MPETQVTDRLVADIAAVELSMIPYIWEIAFLPAKRSSLISEMNKVLNAYCVLCAELFRISPVLFNKVINEKLSLYFVLWHINNILVGVDKFKTKFEEDYMFLPEELRPYSEENSSFINDFHLEGVSLLIQFLVSFVNGGLTVQEREDRFFELVSGVAQLYSEKGDSAVFVFASVQFYFALAEFTVYPLAFETRQLQACMDRHKEFFPVALDAGRRTIEAPSDVLFVFYASPDEFFLFITELAQKK